MALTIQKNDFFDIVQKAYAVAPVKSSLQILSNIVLSCSGKQIEVCATDLNQSIRCRGLVEGSESFQVAVNSRKFYDIVREMPAGAIKIQEDEYVLSMDSEKGFSCKVAGADAADFPAFPSIGDTNDFEITVSDFKRLVHRSSFAVSRESTRSCLCGVLLEADADSITMVATDGHRLGRCTLQTNTGLENKITAIVSPKSLLHVSKICEDGNSEMRLGISVGEKYIVFSSVSFTLYSKLLEGPYPDYDKVIPKHNPVSVHVDRAMLIDAVRRVSVLSSQKTHLVKLQFGNNAIEVTVLNRDIGGEAHESIPVSYDGEGQSIGFNAVYLSEILGIAATERVRIDISTQISACLILPCSEDGDVFPDELFLIMPLRLMDEM